MAFRVPGTQVDSTALLAPMAGMTDAVFRGLCREQGCGLVYTELVHARMLLRGEARTIQHATTLPGERPVGVQLYGTDPDVLAEAARWVEANLHCDLIDLNMGCPVPKIVSRGAGAALMRQPRLVEELVSRVVQAVDLPVSAKTRSGWDDTELNAVDVARAVEAGGGCAVAVHARTRAQRHDGPVNHALLAELKQSVGIPVIGNGGIVDGASAQLMRDETGVDAVMIGRGALGNPWIFAEIAAAWNDEPWEAPDDAAVLAMVDRHLRASIASFEGWARKQRHRDEAELRGVRYVFGHLLHYVAHSPELDAFRRQLSSLETLEGALEAVGRALCPSPNPNRPEPGPTSTDRPAAA